MKKVSFYTLGCKLNQAETSYLVNEFSKRGYTIVSFGEWCDVFVINTCTVTAKTDYKCRQIIRRAIKISPQAIVAAVGCYAQMSADRLKKISGVKLILGSDQKYSIFKYLDDETAFKKAVHKIGRNDKYIDANPGSFRDHTRAFLKIQDGCNNFCSYCIVPYARGRGRSDTLENILHIANQLVDQGYREIVLTGVHIGSYGHDLIPSLSLVDILKRLAEIPNLGRIRLSSLEPMELEDELLDLVANSEKICPHFHIPLQSGDDFILKRMRRNYNVSKYVKIIDRLFNKIPNLALGTDIIAGFPGETEYRFENTYQLVQDLPFTYLHVFSFSPRPGTEATKFSDKVDPQIINERSTRLIELGKQKKHHFYRNALGKQFNVLFEEKTNGKWMYGFTENYIRIKDQKQPLLFNKIVPVIVNNIDDNFALGDILV